jgi:peptidoglycan DL-endopeptidase CwlO
MTEGRSISPVTKVRASIAAAAVGLTLLPGVADAHSFDGHRSERRHLVSRARSQIGAPYRAGGTTPRGFDCSGFTRWVFRRHGSSLPHSSMEQFRLVRSRPLAKRIKKRSKLNKGDLVFHKTGGARVGHAGIYIGDGKFISSTTSGGVRVRSIWDRHYWGPRWVGAVRLRVTQS